LLQRSRRAWPGGWLSGFAGGQGRDAGHLWQRLQRASCLSQL